MEQKVKAIAKVCSLLALAILTGCHKPVEKTAARPQLETKKVRIARVEELPVEVTVPATGSLAAQDRAVMSAKVPGRLETIMVDMGSAVRQGDLVAQIEKRDYELRREQAEAALARARARLGLSLGGEEDKLEAEKASIVKEARAVLGEATKNRDRLIKLREEGVIPDADVETAEAAYQVAVNRYEESIHEAKNRFATLKQRQAELAIVQQQLHDTEIRAPFPGIIEQRQTSPGEFLNIGAPIVTVVRVDPIRARLEVSEKDAPRVHLGQSTRLQIEGSDETFGGKVSRVSPVIAAGNRMLQVEADVANAKAILRPGSFVKGEVVVNENARGVFVPKTAIVTFAGIQKLFIVQQGKAVEKEVSLGRVLKDKVEVLGPAKAGELVVIEPGTLRNGQPVEVMTKSDS
jgi:RND family efflux transporter MFP subunit